MRSLAAKITLAIFTVGVLGVLIFALLVGGQSRQALSSFLSERDKTVLADALETYYAANGSWEGVNGALAQNRALADYTRSAILTNAAGEVIVAPGPPNAADATGNNTGNNFGNAAMHRNMMAAVQADTPTALVVDGETVGYLIFVSAPAGGPNSRFGPIEAGFLRRLLNAFVISAIVTILFALLMGSVVARGLTQPLRELTDATHAMASGDLHQEVSVRARDELGDLARSFNQMSADLAHSSHLRTQMTADLAHDLRTPLTILRGYLEGLADGRLQGDTQLYKIMYEEVELLQRLVEDLRTLSRADAGELVLNRRMVDPAALLERTGLAYFVQAQEQGIDLNVMSGAPHVNQDETGQDETGQDETGAEDGTVEADSGMGSSGLPSISVDTDRMSQVLNNLVTNALHHTSEGSITLDAVQEGENVLLRVHDTGTGIDPADLPFVFDRFYRGDRSRHRGDDGSTGLGLAIAKAIVEAHGGTLRATSALGIGTSFTITLPAVTQPASA